ncbi:MAG: PIG-L family deacetylase [Thermoanaerobaculum sp.]|nr:PIG-L family deacetylase [Thermoanaerobaculum sp.]
MILLPHPDDELFLLPWLQRWQAKGWKLYLVYLTDGGATANPAVRQRETEKVMARFCSQATVWFLGMEYGVPDGKLLDHAQLVLETLNKHLPTPNRVIAPAWEGGHHDHDVTAALAFAFASVRGLPHHVWSYPLYHGKGFPGQLFRISSPLPANGPHHYLPASCWQTLRAAMQMRTYRSQWRTMLAFSPSVLTKALLRPVLPLARIRKSRLLSRPHAGKLLYERRFRVPYERVAQVVQKLLNQS